MNNKIIGILPTLKCNGDCTYCYINNLDQQKSLIVNDSLINNLNNYSDFIVTGGEPLIYKDIYKLLSIITDIAQRKNGNVIISSNLYVDSTKINKLFNICPSLNLFVTYQNTLYNRQFNQNYLTNIEIFKDKIIKWQYNFWIKNYKNLKYDIEWLNNTGNMVEHIFRFEPGDLEFLESVSVTDKLLIKSYINKNFKSFSIQRDAILHDVDFIGPNNSDIYHKYQQNIDLNDLDCTFCFPTNGNKNTCEQCLDYTGSWDKKSKYIEDFKKLINILNI